MPTQQLAALPIFLCLAAFVASCGGGGSLDDGQTPLRTEPQIVTLQSPTVACRPSDGVTVYIFGGVPPYSFRNTVPDAVSLSTGSVGSAGEGVHIRFLGGCLTTVPLVVVDRSGATASVQLNYLPATN